MVQNYTDKRRCVSRDVKWAALRNGEEETTREKKRVQRREELTIEDLFRWELG